MSVKVATNRFIHSSLKSFAGFYQQLLQSVSGFQELGNKLVQEAEKARVFRQIDRLEELGSILSNLPLKEYQIIGHYYQGWCIYRSGENSRTIFEKVIEQSDAYRAKAFISLAALEARSDDYASELKCYTEAIKYARNPTTLVTALRASAVVKAKEGYRKKALKDLERLLPLVRFAQPHLYYDFLNSLAVELCEAGRIEEARNISNIVLASPYAVAYPEWRETSDEIDFRGYCHSRSVVSLNRSTLNTGNVLHLPLPEHTNITSSEQHPRSPFQQQASVTVLKAWKEEKMVKEPDDNDAPNDDSEKDLLFGLMELVAKEDFSIEELHKLIKSAKKIVSERKSEKGTD